MNKKNQNIKKKAKSSFWKKALIILLILAMISLYVILPIMSIRA